MDQPSPGKLVLFGSGEATVTGRRIHAEVMKSLGGRVKVAILETPAGFQPNSHLVAQKLADFFLQRLGELVLSVDILPLRRRDGELSTNNPALLAPLLETQYIFMGPGSPTYAVKHLKDSLAYRTILARHRRGAVLCLASAATIAIGRHCLPVYEIFKVGEDLHWVDGLDLLAHYGLSVTFVTHWNNREGGQELDTSCCFMGRQRMERLLEMLGPDSAVVTIDEHTALIVDIKAGACEVRGAGSVSVLRSSRPVLKANAGESFPLAALGTLEIPSPSAMPIPDIPVTASHPEPELEKITDLLRQRLEARKRKAWSEADALREKLSLLGVEVRDTPQGTLWRMTDNSSDNWSLLPIDDSGDGE